MYFTPPFLSEYVLDRLEHFDVDFGTGRFIDPSAGGASFIGPIASRMRTNGAAPKKVLASLTGIEIDPALAEFARVAATSVIEQDAAEVVVTGNGLELGELGTYDAVIGNPPYRVLSRAERECMPIWAKETLGTYRCAAHVCDDANVPGNLRPAKSPGSAGVGGYSRRTSGDSYLTFW